MSLIRIQTATSTSAPPEFHVVEGKYRVLFAVNGSRLYLLDHSDPGLTPGPKLLSTAAPPPPEIMPEPAALSLNIAQSCNLACGYCYADEGRFGDTPKLMARETAREAIRRHIHLASVKQVSVGFIGGEPLLNREVLHDATAFAASEARARGIAITFGLTTNATLLKEIDLALLRSHPFAVTVSLDGDRATHDAVRPDRRGAPSFDRALKSVTPLLTDSGKSSIAARVTVTRRNRNVTALIGALTGAGFTDVGVSPVRTGPDHSLRIAPDDWPEFLAQMIRAAKADWRNALRTGGRLRFSNFATALRQLFRGACNSLPCGAAASYVSMDADGRYFTCHRTVGDQRFAIGDLRTGLSSSGRQAFVAAAAVDRQEPCRSCWARYLCGGGCHAEVAQAGREGCDEIRGWLEFCMSIYPEIMSRRPDLLITRPADWKAAE